MLFILQLVLFKSQQPPQKPVMLKVKHFFDNFQEKSVDIPFLSMTFSLDITLIVSE
jgi:hypothetical protein